MKQSADGASCSGRPSRRATLSKANVISAIESNSFKDEFKDYHDSDIISDTDDMIESSDSSDSETSENDE